MNNQELRDHYENKIGLTDTNFDHSIVTEQDLKDDLLYYITEIIGDYELLVITDENGRKFKVNPKYMETTEKTWAAWSKQGHWL